MNTEVMFSSKTEMWETPQDFFDKLNEEFHFTLDACATKENAKCENFSLLKSTVFLRTGVKPLGAILHTEKP